MGVSGTGPVDSVPSALFESLEFLRSRELLFRFGSVDLAAPVAVALVTDPVFGTDGFNTGLLALFKYNELLLLAKRNPCFDSGNRYCRF
jgi:hypothetical protein